MNNEGVAQMRDGMKKVALNFGWVLFSLRSKWFCFVVNSDHRVPNLIFVQNQKRQQKLSDTTTIFRRTVL